MAFVNVSFWIPTVTLTFEPLSSTTSTLSDRKLEISTVALSEDLRSVTSSSVPGMITCPNCGELTLAHRVCGNCGFYKGKQVVAPKADSSEE